MKLLVGLFSSVILLSGCAPSIYYVKPREWSPPAAVDSVIRFFQPYLQDKKIFLDPGHGGEDRVNRGPEEDAIEADVNLQVGLALREYLTRAGSTVYMSRTKDTSIALRERPVLAAMCGADMFISLHHNATGNPITNYTSTYYHAYEGHPEYHPAHHDIARYIQRDMSYAMRNASPPFSPTFDGTLSDFHIYPNSGFAVLRHNTLPAVLIEGSFFTHPHEEQRLALSEFNRIEAWGIFLGLGKYFAAGIPDLLLVSDSISTTPKPLVTIGVSSNEEIDPRTLLAEINGVPVAAIYDDSSKTITVRLEQELTGGEHELLAWIKNINGNTSWPFRRGLVVKLPPASLELAVHPPRLPLSTNLLARVTCLAKDKNGDRVVDGSSIRISMPAGGVDTTVFTVHGIASLYVYGSTARESRLIRASADTVSDTLLLGFSTGYDTYLTGVVRSDVDSLPLPGARVMQIAGAFHDSTRILDTTWSDGRYVTFQRLSDPLLLRFQKEGYFTQREELRHATEPSEVNAWLTLLMRSNDTTVAERERAKRSSQYSSGMYVRVDASGKEEQAACRIYPSLTNAAFAGMLLQGLRLTSGLDSLGIFPSRERFYYDVAMGTITVVVPSTTTGYYDGMKESAIDAIAWGLFMGILQSEGFVPDSTDTYSVTDSINGNGVFGESVILGETLEAVTDANGTVNFFGLGSGEDDLRVRGNARAVVKPRINP
jgi:N-acetylmuramoyl-L-alanine amidase